MDFKKGMSLLAVALAVFISGCAKKRPVKEVLPEVHRLEKGFFTEGEFYYTVTVVGTTADTPVTRVGDSNFGPSLAQFEFTEGHLTAYAPDPRFKEKSSRMKPVLSFPVERHVDIQRVKNDDDEETHIEAETERERPFQERKYVKVNFARTNLLASDLLGLSIYKRFDRIKEISSDLIDLSQDSESLNITLRKGFEVAKLGPIESLPDTPSFSADIKISFLRKKENPKFKPTLMTDRHLNHVGFFSTTVKEYGKYNEEQEKRYAAHWSPDKEIVFTISENFPKKYKSIAQTVINHWNDVLKDPKVSGKPLLKLKDNQGEEIGDIRHPMIAWIDDPIDHGPVGYGPMHYDPFTGEMFQANVYLYAGNMRQFILYLLENREVYFDAKAEAEETVEGKSDGENGSGGRYFPERASATLPARKGNISTLALDIRNSNEFPPKGLEAFLVKPFLKALEDEKTIEGALFKYRNLSGRCFYPGVADRADIGWYLGNLTEEELFEKTLADVLSHEIGHTLGLRHNFKGSVDKKHYISNDIKLSSTMDYPSLETANEGKPGPYDQAALSFAFGGEFDFQKNYLFCADEDLMTDPMCNQFDQGSSAKEIADYLAKRYEETYERRNLRGKRLTFTNTPEDIRNYKESLLTYYFLPMREFMDQMMFVNEQKTTLKGEPLRQEEFEELFADLMEATAAGFNFFSKILMDSSRSYSSILNLAKGTDEILVRGTEIDKILATQMLTLRDYGSEPWGKTLKTTYFDIPAFALKTEKSTMASPDYQKILLQFYSRLIKDPNTPLPIAFLSSHFMINEVPHPTDARSRFYPFGIPSETVLELFKITKIELNAENGRKIIDPNKYYLHYSNEVEYFIEPEEGVIYTAKKHPILFFNEETPAAYLVRTYKETQAQLNALSNQYNEQLSGNQEFNGLRVGLMMAQKAHAALDNLFNKRGLYYFSKDEDELNDDLSDLKPEVMQELDNFIADKWVDILIENEKITQKERLIQAIQAKLAEYQEEKNYFEQQIEQFKAKVSEQGFGIQKQMQYYHIEKQLKLLKLRIDLLHLLMQQRSLSLGG